MKITLAQLNPTIGDFPGNLNKAISVLRIAQKDKADIICFPEMFLTGYPPRDLLERNDFINHAQRALKDLVKYSQKVQDIANEKNNLTQKIKSMARSSLILALCHRHQTHRLRHSP